MSFGDRLKESRENLGLNQTQLGEMVGVGNTTISNYEKGISFPNVDFLYKLFEALDVDPNFLFQDEINVSNKTKKNILSIKERNLIENYQRLDEHGKEVVDSTINLELKRIDNSKIILPIYDERKINWGNPQTELLPVYSIPVAAGYGEQLDDNIDHYKIEVPINETAKKADFVIRVSGDSMEPEFYNGDMLFVKEQEAIELNEIGIFVLNNEGYVKRLGKNKLISINPKYDDIRIREFDNLKCIGKVLGKV